MQDLFLLQSKGRKVSCNLDKTIGGFFPNEPVVPFFFLDKTFGLGYTTVYVALENIHSAVVISTPRKTLSYSSKMLRHLSGITFLPEGTYVIVIEEEIHMGKGERVMKLGMNIQKGLAFFLSDSITKTFLSISEL